MQQLVESHNMQKNTVFFLNISTGKRCWHCVSFSVSFATFTVLVIFIMTSQLGDMIVMSCESGPYFGFRILRIRIIRMRP